MRRSLCVFVTQRKTQPTQTSQRDEDVFDGDDMRYSSSWFAYFSSVCTLELFWHVGMCVCVCLLGSIVYRISNVLFHAKWCDETPAKDARARTQKRHRIPNISVDVWGPMTTTTTTVTRNVNAAHRHSVFAVETADTDRPLSLIIFITLVIMRLSGGSPTETLRQANASIQTRTHTHKHTQTNW